MNDERGYHTNKKDFYSVIIVKMPRKMKKNEKLGKSLKKMENQIW